MDDVVPLSGRRGVDSWGPAEGTARGATIVGTSGRYGAGGPATDPAPAADDDGPAWAAQGEGGTRRRVGVDPPATDDDPQGDRDRPQTNSGNRQPGGGVNDQPEGGTNEAPPVGGTTPQVPTEPPTRPDTGGEQTGDGDEQPVEGDEQPVEGDDQAGDVEADTKDPVLQGSGSTDKDGNTDTAAGGSGGATDEDPVLVDPDARPQGDRPSAGPETAESADAGQ